MPRQYLEADAGHHPYGGGRRVKDRIGVFICECGPNIKDAMDIPKLVRFAGQLEAVVLAEPAGLMYAPDG